MSNVTKVVDAKFREAEGGLESLPPLPIRPAYQTEHGTMFHGLAESMSTSRELKGYQGKIQLILTSPPFPLNRKKKYGNRKGEEYVTWLKEFAGAFRRFLRPRGSIVVEMGNAWTPGKPVMSTLSLEALLALKTAGKFYLCEQFVCYNPARLPSPAQWVNIERIRVKDSFTHIWWLSPTSRPKATNRRVLKPYSDSMMTLLRTKRYNSGKRPSEWDIGQKSFFTLNKGAIPSNVIVLANTSAHDRYLEHCRKHNLAPQPARMHSDLARFFIRMLTQKGDMVMDPFAGSNTTGAVAEEIGREWISIECREDYVRSSIGRFDPALVRSPSARRRSRRKSIVDNRSRRVRIGSRSNQKRLRG